VFLSGLRKALIYVNEERKTTYTGGVSIFLRTNLLAPA